MMSFLYNFLLPKSMDYSKQIMYLCSEFNAIIVFSHILTRLFTTSTFLLTLNH